MRSVFVIGVAVVVFSAASFVLIPRPSKQVEAEPAPIVATTTTPHISLHDVYKKGTHTITGSVEAPTACASVAALATTTPAESSSTPPVITVSVSISSDQGICLQEEAHATFSVSLAAPKNAVLQALVNGIIASTTQS